MYVCRDCLSIFPWPNRYVDKHGLDELPYEVHYGCPICGGAYNHVYECTICGNYAIGDYVETSDGQIFCEDCFRVHNNLEEDDL